MIFVDGSNWYFKLRELLAPMEKTPKTDFDIRGLSEELVAPAKLLDIYYYIGKLKRKRGNAKGSPEVGKENCVCGKLHQKGAILWADKLV